MNLSYNNAEIFSADSFAMTIVDLCNYVPIYALGTLYTNPNHQTSQYYKKPDFDSIIVRKNTIKIIREAIAGKWSLPTKIKLGDKDYFFVKGGIFNSKKEPLLLMVLDKKYFQDLTENNYPEVIKSYVVMYSSSFFTDPNLATLNRRFQKEILMSCYEKGMEVRVITSSEIERNTFANLFEIPKANSVSQLEDYMKTVLPTILYTKEEDNFVFKELEVPVEELSVEEEALMFDNEATIENLIVPVAVESNRQITLDEAIEMAEIEAEARFFDPIEVFDEEDEENWEDNSEQEEDEEELERHEMAAHTVLSSSSPPLSANIYSIELIDDTE